MIMKPEEMTFDDKKFSMILYGSPGVGKTSLALSSPNPVLIDFDKGISRVKAYHRKATIVCDKYEDVLSDMNSEEIKEFETVIIDTGGSFVTYLQDWAMRQNPAVNRQKNGAISLKGFGVVKQEFVRFTNYVKDTLHKNIIYVFHAEEKQDKDGNAVNRLLCEGAAKNIVWQPCDFGGFMQMVGNRRVVSFTPTDEYFAKGCYGIDGQMEIPTLGAEDKNDFLTRLFEKAKENIQAENEAFAPVQKEYEVAMIEAKEIVDGIDSVAKANDAVQALANMKHALTSKKESRALLMQRVKELGYVLNKETKQYEEE